MTIMHPSFAAADDDRVTTCRAQTGAGQPPPGVAMSLTEKQRRALALVGPAPVRDQSPIQLLALEVRSGSKGCAHAQVVLRVDGVRRSARSDGAGAVDAAVEAIRAIVPHKADLQLVSVGAMSKGAEDQARTAVRLTEAGRVVDGHGSDPDPIVSATRAYIHALNQLQAQDQGPMAFVGDFWRL